MRGAPATAAPAAPNRRAPLAVFGVAAVLLAALTLILRTDWAKDLNADVTYDVVFERSGAAASFFRTVTSWFNTPGTVALCVVALVAMWVAQTFARAMIAPLAVALASAITFSLKYAIDAQRPPQQLRLVEEYAHSYPSGHTTAATALALGLMVAIVPLVPAMWRIVVVAVALAVAAMVALSRVYLGVHWAADVTAGFLSAAAGTALAVLVAQLLPGGRDLP